MRQLPYIKPFLLLLTGLILTTGFLFADPVVINTSSTDLTCFNSNDGTITVNITSGTANYNYYLSTGNFYFFPGYVHVATATGESSTTHVFSGLDVGTYYILVTDVHNDIGYSTESITEPPALSGGVITVEKALTCYDGNDAILLAHPSGGTGPYTYAWYYDNPTPPTNYVFTGVTTVDYTVAGRGKYYVLVDDANGCGPISSATISFIEFINDSVPLSLLTASATASPACGAASNGSITITGSGGWSPYQYSIVNSVPATIGPQASGTFSGLPADTYQTWITDDKGCTEQGNDVTVLSTTPPTVNAGGDGGTCQDVSYDLATSVPAPSQSNTVTLTWSDGGAGGSFSNPNILLPIYTPPAGFAGNITLTLTGTGNSPCGPVNDNMTLTVTAAPVVNAGGDGETCQDAAYNLATSTPPPSQSNTSSLSWSDGGAGGSFNNPNILQPIYTPPAGYSGTITLTLTGNGNGTCAPVNDAMLLTVTAPPSVNAGGDGSTCQDVAYNLATSVPAPSQSNTSSLAWSDGGAGGSFSNPNILLPTYTPPAGFSGNITLTLTGNGNGSCPPANDNMTLTVTAAPVVNAGGDGETCQNNAYDLSTSIPIPSESNTSSLSWSDGGIGGSFNNSSILLPIYTPPAGYSGTITLTLTGNGNGTCAPVNDAMLLTVTAAPVVNAGGDGETCQDVTYDLATSVPAPSQSNTSSLSWNDGGAGGSFSNPNILQPTYTPPAGFSGVIILTLTGNGNGSCPPVNDNMNLTVTAAPVVNAGGDGETCQDGTYDLSTSIPVPSTLNTSSVSWSDGGAGGSFSNPNVLMPVYTPPLAYSGNITLTLTGNGNGSCAPTADAMILTVTAAPVVVAGGDASTCEDVPYDLSTSIPAPTQTNTSSLSWSDGGAGGSFNNPNILQPVYTPPAGFSGTIILTLTGNGNGSCPPTSDFMTLTVNGSASVNAGGDGETCQATPYDLSGSVPPPSETNTTSLTWDDGGAGGSHFEHAAALPAQA